MKSELINIKEIKTNPLNPRIIKDDKYKKLVKSIQEFPEMLELRPLVIDENNIVLGGNMRLRVLHELKYKQVPCVRVKDLTAEQKNEFIIKDNLGYGEWDWDALGNDWGAELLDEWGLDIPDVSNFGDDKTEEELNDVPEPPKKPVSQIGDLFLLDGKHRVLCGDSTKEQDVSKLMDGKKADMVFTDPPYGVSYGSKNKYLNKSDGGNRIETDIENDTKPKETFALWENHFKLYSKILNKVHSVYIASPQTRDLMMMMSMIESGGIYISNVIIWVKNNHVLGRLDYMLKHEPIIYGWLKSGTHKFYGEGNQKFSVWEIDKPKKNDLHPTMKPVELVENALLNSSKRNDVIYDGFLGSGSTLIASEQTNRVCYGMELEPIYIDVILKRYKKLYPEKEIKCLNRKFDFDKLFAESA